MGSLFHSGSRLCPPPWSTSMTGISSGATAAPGPSLKSSFSLISQRLRDAMGPDEPEVYVHEHHDQSRQQKNMGGEENLKGLRANHRSALEHGLDEGAEECRRWRAGDLDRDLRREVGLGVPWQQVPAQGKDKDDQQHEHADNPVQLPRSPV